MSSSSSLIFSRHSFPRDLSVQAITTCFHESIRFAVPALMALLGLSFQLSDYSITIGFAGCTLLVYFLAISGQLDFSLAGYSASRISSNSMIWSGKLLVGLLASLLFPELIRFVLFLPFWVFMITDKRLLLLVYDRFLNSFSKKMASISYFARGRTNILPR